MILCDSQTTWMQFVVLSQGCGDFMRLDRETVQQARQLGDPLEIDEAIGGTTTSGISSDNYLNTWQHINK